MTETESKLRHYLERTLIELENTRLKRKEPIAIIGIGCRFPGGVNTPNELWELIMSQTDAITDFPSNRGWDIKHLFDSNPNTLGKSYSTKGGFLHQSDLFDADFFNITPLEALSMDPQQRLLLEVAFESIEHARIDPLSLQDTATGVFIGNMYSDYGARMMRIPNELEGHLQIGSAPSISSGRIAYALGLGSAAVTIDTACSSSLVALHMACQSLRQNECNFALAGGVTIMSTPWAFIEFSRQQGLSPSGRCKSFSADADGVSWAEGVGIIMLERLSDAKKNNHRVLAVIRGSAVNQDGKSQGLTAPNGVAQQRVIRQALKSANLSAADIDVVEAHGTGTRLGDPIEAEALLAVYGQEHTKEQPLYLGSVKSNIGHTQAAAGVTGVIKMILAMQNQMLPPTLHAQTPSPHIDWSSGTLQLLTQPVDWLSKSSPRRAAISAFGLSGTNAHLILEEAPELPSAQTGILGNGQLLPFLFSAKNQSALCSQAEKIITLLNNDPNLSLNDLAYSLAVSRSHFRHQAVILSDVREDLLTSLQALTQGHPLPATLVSEKKSHGKLVMLFTGQGSQYVGMGEALYQHYSIFSQTFDSLCETLSPLLDLPKNISLKDVTFSLPPKGSPSLLDQTAFTQPALFILEVALFRLLESLDIKPDIVLGHSIGEVVAAHIAGVFSQQDACRLIAARGRLMQAQPSGGVMIAIQASEAEVLEQLDGLEHQVSIAALNGPMSIVISGDKNIALTIAEHFTQQGRRTTQLAVSHAFHSPHMEGMQDEFHQIIGNITFNAPQIPIISNLTGKLVTEQQICQADYWVKHVRAPVRFSEGIHVAESYDNMSDNITFLEIGPHAILTSMASQCLQLDALKTDTFIAPIIRGSQDNDELMNALAMLHNRSFSINWSAVFEPYQVKLIDLPTYSFQRQRYWLDAPTETNNIVQPLSFSSSATNESPIIENNFIISALSLQSVEERQSYLADMVNNCIAKVMHLENTQLIMADRSLQEMGLDSMMISALRLRLATITGLDLPPTLLFDYPTPKTLTNYLHYQITQANSVNNHHSSSDEKNKNIQPFELKIFSNQKQYPLLSQLVSQAFCAQQFEHGKQLLDAIGHMAQRFTHESFPLEENVAIKLASGLNKPSLYCIAPYLPMGAFEYADFASHFQQQRNVWVLPNPGFSVGQTLPCNIEQVLKYYQNAIQQSSNNQPFVLVGHSGGGLLAHALTSYLEFQGLYPAGLILIDSYPTGSMNPEFQKALMLYLGKLWSTMPPADEQMIASAWYQRLLEGQQFPDIITPMLSIRCQDPLPSLKPSGDDWKTQWPQKVTTIDVSGDHFSMIHQQSNILTTQIQQWLEKL